MAQRIKFATKDPVKKDDAFIEIAGQSVQWLQNYRRNVVIGAIVAILALAGVWAVVDYAETRDQRASVLLTAAGDLLDARIAGTGEEAAPTAKPPVFASEKDKWTLVRDKAKEATEAAGSRAVGHLATLLWAHAETQLGDKDAAEKLYLSLVDSWSGDDLQFLAIERAAYMKEDKGEIPDALSLLGKLSGTGFYEDFGRFHQGRLQLARGEREEAKKLWSSIESDFKDSSLKGAARDHLAALTPEPPPEAAPKAQ